MFELLFSFVFGALSIFSPCVLPVLPILLASSDGKILNSILTFTGLLVGIAILLSFSASLLILLKIIAYPLLLLFAASLLSEKIELKISTLLSKFTPKSLLKLKSRPFLLGFTLSFIWLPCILPFAGTTAYFISEEPLSLVFYLSGLAFAVAFILKVGGGLIRENFEVVKKVAAAMIIFYLIYTVL
ncbi:MAG: hypothetical protein QXM06_00660 [Archaeoglobaceae archaeon]